MHHWIELNYAKFLKSEYEWRNIGLIWAGIDSTGSAVPEPQVMRVCNVVHVVHLGAVNYLGYDR